MFLLYPNSQDEILVQRKSTHNSVITITCMLGNQSDVFNLNKQSKRNLKKNFYTINAMLIKLCFVRIVNVYLLVTYCLHLFTCDNKDRFLNSDMSTYNFHIEMVL